MNSRKQYTVTHGQNAPSYEPLRHLQILDEIFALADLTVTTNNYIHLFCTNTCRNKLYPIFVQGHRNGYGRYGIDRTTFQLKKGKKHKFSIINFVIIVPSTCCTNSNLIFEKVQDSGGFTPSPPLRGSAPWPPLGYNPQTPVLALPLLFRHPCICLQNSTATCEISDVHIVILSLQQTEY